MNQYFCRNCDQKLPFQVSYRDITCTGCGALNASIKSNDEENKPRVVLDTKPTSTKENAVTKTPVKNTFPIHPLFIVAGVVFGAIFLMEPTSEGPKVITTSDQERCIDLHYSMIKDELIKNGVWTFENREAARLMAIKNCINR